MRQRAGVLWVAWALAAGVACGGAEGRVVDQYFGAVRQGDDQTLSSFAAVRFDKKVENWSLVEAAPDERVPAPLMDLVKQAKEAEQAFEENRKAYRAYFLQYPIEVDKVQEALKKGSAIPASLRTHGDKWKGFLDNEKEFKKNVAETKEALDKEKRLVQLSMGQVEDLESLSGDMLIKKLLVDVTSSGETQRYEMVLRKYDLQDSQGIKPLSRWIVYDLQAKA